MRSVRTRLNRLLARRTRSVCAAAFLAGIALGQSPLVTAVVFTILQFAAYVAFGYLAYELWCFHREFGFKWLPGGGHRAE